MNFHFAGIIVLLYQVVPLVAFKLYNYAVFFACFNICLRLYE